MGRRYQHFHLLKGPAPEDAKRGIKAGEFQQMLCGELGNGRWGARWFEDADHPRINCPDCLKIITRQALAEHDAAGLPKLELKKIEHHRYRYTYEAWFGGEHVGYIGMEAGWGSSEWKISRITAPRDVEKDPDDKPWTYEMGHEIGVDPDYEKHPHARFKATVYASKERALLAVPALMEAGKLKSVAKTIEDGKARVIRVRASRERLAREEAERIQARSDMIEALRSIRDRAERGEIALRNSEVDGLMTAIVKFEKIAKAPETMFADEV